MRAKGGETERPPCARRSSPTPSAVTHLPIYAFWTIATKVTVTITCVLKLEVIEFIFHREKKAKIIKAECRHFLYFIELRF